MEEVAFLYVLLQLLNSHLGQGKDLSAAAEGESNLYLKTHDCGTGLFWEKVPLILSVLATVYK